MAYLPFDMDYLTDEMIRRAELELGETKETRERCLKQLWQCIENDKTICFSKEDEVFLALLRAKKFKVDRVMALLRIGLRYKECFEDRFYLQGFEFIKEACRNKVINILPHRDKNDAVIFFLQYRTLDFNRVSLEAYLFIIIFIIRSSSFRFPATQICGIQLICDLEGVGIKDIRHLSASLLQNAIRCANTSSAVRLRGCHILNAPAIAYYMWKIVQMTLSAKLQKRVHFHTNDFTSLHKEFDPAYLPAEFGGTLIYDNSLWLDVVQELKYYHDRHHEAGLAHFGK